MASGSAGVFPAITDPIDLSSAQRGLLHRWAVGLVNDGRDIVFLRLMLVLSVTVLPFAAVLFVPGVFRWSLAAIYWAVVLYFTGPFILMLHLTSHRRLSRHGWLNRYIPWVLGPFFGETPNTYYAHHIGMHHPENNLPDDLSCTMGYRRDSLAHFMVYWLRFFLVGIVELSIYLYRRRRFHLMRAALVGELGFYAVTAGLLWLSWRPALTVLVVPFVVTRFLMMAGNWGQHAFVDADDPGNACKNSISCINTGYNKRCFNDGYHIGHHIRPNRHWLEMPRDLLDSRQRYAADGAIVFSGIDFFGVWLLLMLKAYGRLARHYVALDGKGRSREQVVALLRQRTRSIALH